MRWFIFEMFDIFMFLEICHLILLIHLPHHLLSFLLTHIFLLVYLLAIMLMLNVEWVMKMIVLFIILQNVSYLTVYQRQIFVYCLFLRRGTINIRYDVVERCCFEGTLKMWCSCYWFVAAMIVVKMKVVRMLMVVISCLKGFGGRRYFVVGRCSWLSAESLGKHSISI